VGDDGDRAVVLGARHTARVVLARQKAALTVARVAVRVVGGLAEYAHPARLLLPPHDAVVGYVAPQEVAAVAEPHRPFAPAHARGDALDLGLRDAVAREAPVDDPDRGIGIALARLPLRERARYGGKRRSGRACGEYRASLRIHCSPSL